MFCSFGVFILTVCETVSFWGGCFIIDLLRRRTHRWFFTEAGLLWVGDGCETTIRSERASHSRWALIVSTFLQQRGAWRGGRNARWTGVCNEWQSALGLQWIVFQNAKWRLVCGTSTLNKQRRRWSSHHWLGICRGNSSSSFRSTSLMAHFCHLRKNELNSRGMHESHTLRESQIDLLHPYACNKTLTMDIDSQTGTLTRGAYAGEWNDSSGWVRAQGI